MKNMKIKLTDSDNNSYKWTVQRVPRATQCMITHTRIIHGWDYTDHEGCIRFAEGTWKDLVDAFRLTAENYGFTTNIS